MESIQINIEELIQECLSNSELDIDTSFCDGIKFKFDNHEIDVEGVDLLTSEVNKKAFKFVFPNADID